MPTHTEQREVLVVEDELPIRELLSLHLSAAGFAVTTSADGSSALQLARATRFDVIVLDVMLPGLDGVTLCRAIRTDSMNRGTAILMLTARDAESDKVMGLESGADDYVTKPFGIREVMARVKSLLRRGAHIADSEQSPQLATLTRGELSINASRRAVTIHGTAVDLTKQEFDLLYLLASRPGVVFSRSALMSKVWNGDTYVTERTVDTVVSRLRRKLKSDPRDPALLLTVWGVGYKFGDAD